VSADSLRLPAEHGNLPALIGHCQSHARTAGMAEARLVKVQLVVEELAVNVVSYAYPGGSGFMEARCGREPDGDWFVEIRDSGVPFNPLQAEEPYLGGDMGKRRVGGLGVFLSQQMADELRYRREGDENVVTACFSLAG
jgi:anti-sigma regulatory factor (Ser/Thr protein kinase)